MDPGSETVNMDQDYSPATCKVDADCRRTGGPNGWLDPNERCACNDGTCSCYMYGWFGFVSTLNYMVLDSLQKDPWTRTTQLLTTRTTQLLAVKPMLTALDRDLKNMENVEMENVTFSCMVGLVCFYTELHGHSWIDK